MAYKIIQDTTGRIWTATDNGIGIWDGYQFVCINKDDGLPGHDVINLYKLRNGSIWATFTNGRVCVFENGFKSINSPWTLPAEVCNGTFVTDILLDSKGAYWISSYGTNGKSSLIKTNKYEYSSIDEVKVNRVYAIWENENNEIWAATDSGYFNVNTKKHVESGRNIRVRFPRFIRHAGLLYTADHRGLFQFNGISEREIVPIGEYSFIGNCHFVQMDSIHIILGGEQGVVVIENWTKIDAIRRKLLEPRKVSSAVLDREGWWWFSTLNTGIFTTASLKISTYEVRHQHTGNQSYCINTDQNGTVFSGLDNGEILRIKNQQTSNHIAINNPTSRNRFTKTYKDNEGDVWLYGDYSFINASTTELSCNDKIYGMINISPDSLLISGSNGIYVMSKLDVTDCLRPQKYLNLPFHHISSMEIDSIGNLWFGNINGLYKCITRDFRNPEEWKTVSDESISDIKGDGKQLYISSPTKGVALVDTSGLVWINETSGLTCHNMKFDHRKVLWVATNKGLVKLKKDVFGEYDSKIFNALHGLPSRNVYDVSFSEDTIWISSAYGVSFVHQEELQINKSRPLIELAGFEIGGINKKISGNRELQIAFNESVEFHFKSIHHSSRGQAKYEYMLLGLDTNWITTNNHSVIYSKPEPGKYSFKLRSMGINSLKSYDTVELNFQVLPPFYRTWWFYSFLITGFMVLVYWFFKVRIFIYNKDVLREIIKLLIIRLKKEKYITVKCNGILEKISIRKILFIQGAKQYVKFQTNNRSYLVLIRLKEAVEMLPSSNFVQVHRSYVVNISKINSITSGTIGIKGFKIPVGNTFSNTLLKLTKKWSK